MIPKASFVWDCRVYSQIADFVCKLWPMKTEDLIAFRHDLHRAPELGFQEERTKVRVA